MTCTSAGLLAFLSLSQTQRGAGPGEHQPLESQQNKRKNFSLFNNRARRQTGNAVPDLASRRKGTAWRARDALLDVDAGTAPEDTEMPKMVREGEEGTQGERVRGGEVVKGGEGGKWKRG